MQPPCFGRAGLEAAARATHPTDADVGRALPCAAGESCVVAVLSDDRVRGVQLGDYGGHLCPLCEMRRVDIAIAAGEQIRATTFSVRVGPGGFRADECYPWAYASHDVIGCDFPVCPNVGWDADTGAVTLRWRSHDRPVNERVAMYDRTQRGAARPEFLHVPGTAEPLIAPLLFCVDGGWRYIDIEECAGQRFFAPGEDLRAWEAAARRWDNASQRLFRGAVLDAAAWYVAHGQLPSKYRAPWFGDLPDAPRAARLEFSPVAAPGAHGDPEVTPCAIVAYCTDAFPNRPRSMRAQPRVQALVRRAWLHMALGTFPVPDEPPTVAQRAAVFAQATNNPPPIEAKLAMFYLRYLSHARQPGWQPDAFWTRLVQTVHALARIGLGDWAARAAEAERFLKFRRTQAVVPPRAPPGYASVAIAPSGRGIAFYCPACRVVVFGARGTAGPCRRVKAQRRGGGKVCCCTAGDACRQHRFKGCCSPRAGRLAVDVTTGVVYCRNWRPCGDDCLEKRGEGYCSHRRVCGQPLDRVDLTGGALYRSPQRHGALFVGCSACGMACYYRRLQHGEVYTCPCAEPPGPPCWLCGRDTCAGGVSTVVGREMRRVRLCAVCKGYAWAIHLLWQAPAADVHYATMARFGASIYRR